MSEPDGPPAEQPKPLAPREVELLEEIRQFVLPERQAEAALVIHSLLESYKGPIPPAREMRGHEAVLPGAANRILTMAEEEQRHRHSIHHNLVGRDFRLKKRGQSFAMAALVLLLLVVVYFVWAGHAQEGMALGIAVIVMVVASFLGPEVARFFGKRSEPASEDDTDD